MNVSDEAHPIVVGLNAVIVAVTDDMPRVVTVDDSAPPVYEGDLDGEPAVSLPFGALDPTGHPTLERALRGWVREQAGLDLGYVEQLYTFGDRFRDPGELDGGPRVVSVAYLALVRELEPRGTARPSWRGWYEFFPWEDWRSGQPEVIRSTIAPALFAWGQAASDEALRRARRERTEITFGLRGVAWDGERVLERYELLYEAGLVFESVRDRALLQTTLDVHTPVPSRSAVWMGADIVRAATGEPMALDHRRILATAMGRLRGKITYRPVVFELLPARFTLLQLQRVVEALAGVGLHKQNFRRLVEKGGLVEGTGQLETRARGRPAELFSFRREVLRERPAPGVGLPVERRGDSQGGRSF